MRYYVTLDGSLHTIDVVELPGGGYDVRVIAPGSKPVSLDADVAAREGMLNVRIGGRVLDLAVDGALPELEIYASGRRASVQVESERTRTAASVRARNQGQSGGVVTSPMPGRVVKVLVNEGDQVDVGAALVVVEAMKMENELVAGAAGVVKKIYVRPGEAVEGGARLIAVG
jgi:glutaconyl-CoA/methylmalonyl-CoA decarboxylase subunit gamma